MNRLSRAGNVSQIRWKIPDRGPNFYDVSGDLNISASDAFRVINYLARQQNGLSEEGEAPTAASLSPPATVSPSAISDTSGNDPDESLARAAFIEAADKIVASSRLEMAPMELIDQIAQPGDHDDDDDDRVEAIDAAIKSMIV